MLLKMVEWPGFRPHSESLFLTEEKRPNTRYMSIRPNEYRRRPVLPDPSMFGTLTGEAESWVSLPDSAQQPAGTQQPLPLKMDATRPPLPVLTNKRELVTLLENARRGRARVRTEDGQIVVCTKLVEYFAKEGKRCWAMIARQDGTAHSAIFHSWNI